MPDHDARAYAAPHNTTHPVGRCGVTGMHHADDCPMRAAGATGCICGREGERDAVDQTLREAVDDMRAWVAMQHEASGLDSSAQAAGEFHAYKRVLSHLLKILATHRAEPVTAEVEITDEAVEAAAEALQQVPAREGLTPTPWGDEPEDIRDMFRREARCALEAAAPLLGPRPLLDRDALGRALVSFGADVRLDPSQPAEMFGMAVDAVMGLARPMPTSEAIEQRVRRIYINGGAHVTHAQQAAAEIAAAVLALLNGAGS